MTKWILVMIIVGNNNAITTTEFKTEKACVDGLLKFKSFEFNMSHNPQYFGFCQEDKPDEPRSLDNQDCSNTPCYYQAGPLINITPTGGSIK